MVATVDTQHYAEVELSPGDRAVRGWRVRCACSWTGLWRASLGDAVAEYDEHLAENGIMVFDGSWWLWLPELVPAVELTPDPEPIASACRIWAAEAVAQVERLCRWVRTPEIDPGR
jgi:hypothetical protein